MKEKWKTIKNFKNVEDNLYQVSNIGEVRVISDKSLIHKKIANKKNHPYYAVNLMKKTGKKEWVLVHQLVATYFVKIPDKYKNTDKELVPDHIDNNGLNNVYTNLRWKTRGENVKLAHDNGFINNSGENHNDAIINDKEARKICKFLEKGFDYDVIISKMNFPNNKSYRTLLVRIKNRIAWKNISAEYNFDSCMIKYTKTQKETIKNIPMIQKYISEGKGNYEVVRLIYGDSLTSSKLSSKAMTIGNIRKKKIFKELL